MKQKRIFCALLSSLIFAASCGSQGSAPGGDTTSTGDTTTAETTKPGIISKLTPGLKEELGLDGYEFNIFLRAEGTTWSLKDVVSDGETGDILNDAVFRLTRHPVSSRHIYSPETTVTTRSSRWAERLARRLHRGFCRTSRS